MQLNGLGLKKYLWFRFHIVKKLGLVGRKFFLKYFFHGFGGFFLGDLQ